MNVLAKVCRPAHLEACTAAWSILPEPLHLRTFTARSWPPFLSTPRACPSMRWLQSRARPCRATRRPRVSLSVPRQGGLRLCQLRHRAAGCGVEADPGACVRPPCQSLPARPHVHAAWQPPLRLALAAWPCSLPLSAAVPDYRRPGHCALRGHRPYPHAPHRRAPVGGPHELQLCRPGGGCGCVVSCCCNRIAAVVLNGLGGMSGCLCPPGVYLAGCCVLVRNLPGRSMICMPVPFVSSGAVLHGGRQLHL